MDADQLGAPPLLSVIVPCTRPHLVEGIARALAAEPRADRCELLVVGSVADLDSGGWGVSCTLIVCAARHPNLRRSIGVEAARGGVLAFLDDDAVPEPGWLDVALDLDAGAMEIWTGPELPVQQGRRARLAHAVASSPLAEGHRAHVGAADAEVAWYEAPFCNLVTTAAVVTAIGPPPVDVPWDMDDFAWCRSAALAGASFHNRVALRVRHDRYPNSVTEWLATKAAERSRTGEKLVRYPGVYLRLPGAAVAAVVPLVALLVLIVAQPIRPFLVLGGAVAYLAVAAVALVRSGVRPRAVPLHVLGTAALHAVSVAAMYVGMAIGAVGMVLGRRDRFLLEEASPAPGVQSS